MSLTTRSSLTAVLFLSLAAASATADVIPTGPSDVPLDDLDNTAIVHGQITDYVSVYEIKPQAHGQTPLYVPEASTEGPKPLRSEYTIDRHSDLLLHIDPQIARLGGTLTIRARLLRDPPTEVAVENYTAVNDKQLKQEQHALLATDTQLFRDVNGADLQRQYAELIVAAGDFVPSLDRVERIFGDATTGPARQSFSDSDFDAFRLAIDDLRFKRQALSNDLATITTAVDEGVLQSPLMERLGATVHDQVEEELGKVRGDLLRWQVVLGSDIDTSGYFMCRKQLYQTDADVTVKVDKKAKKIPKGTILEFDADGKIATPVEFAGVDYNDLGKALSSTSTIDVACAAPLVKTALDKMVVYRATLSEISTQQHFEQIESARKELRGEIRKLLSNDVRDARINVGALDASHDERLEVTIRVVTPGASTLTGDGKSSGDESGDLELVETITFRIADVGWSHSIAPQFALIKRLSDVRSPTESEVPSNFKPAAGAMLSFRYRTRSRASDWLIPSVGIAAFAVDFDPRQSFELGAGVGLGWLNEYVHAGLGVSLFADGKRGFGWISLDFAKTVDTFSTLFQGGGK